MIPKEQEQMIYIALKGTERIIAKTRGFFLLFLSKNKNCNIAGLNFPHRMPSAVDR